MEIKAEILLGVVAVLLIAAVLFRNEILYFFRTYKNDGWVVYTTQPGVWLVEKEVPQLVEGSTPGKTYSLREFCEDGIVTLVRDTFSINPKLGDYVRVVTVKKQRRFGDSTEILSYEGLALIPAKKPSHV